MPMKLEERPPGERGPGQHGNMPGYTIGNASHKSTPCIFHSNSHVFLSQNGWNNEHEYVCVVLSLDISMYLIPSYQIHLVLEYTAVLANYHIQACR